MSALDTTAHPSSDTQGSYSYSETLKTLHYGPGSVLTALPALLEELQVKKALIVTGKSLFEDRGGGGEVKQVEAVLRSYNGNAFAGIFHEIGEHSPIAGIRKGVQVAKELGVDVLVAVGGGSPIDAAKSIRHFLQKETGAELIKEIAIPTTLSAAEYTVGAGYTNDEGAKASVSSPQLAPNGIILDANLTLKTPERLWLSTGLRALDHAIENLYRAQVPPPIKFMCYGAIADLFTYLPQSKANPGDVVIRQKLQIASWMSLFPLKYKKYSATGLSHALGHKLGATYGIPHGMTSCLTLAPVIALKAEIASEEDKKWLADALFFLRRPTSGIMEKDILTLSAAVQSLVDDLGLRCNLSQYNVPRGDLPKVAQLAMGGKDDPNFSKVVQLLEDIHGSPENK